MAMAVATKNTRETPTKIKSYMADSSELLCTNEGITQISEQPNGT
jgi:hypothetical protein